MVIGKWKYEISAKKMFKIGVLSSLFLGSMYLGEACHIKRGIDSFFRSPVAEDSYDSSNIDIIARNEFNGSNKVSRTYYERDGIEYRVLSDGFPLLPKNNIKNQPNYALALLDEKKSIMGEIQKELKKEEKPWYKRLFD